MAEHGPWADLCGVPDLRLPNHRRTHLLDGDDKGTGGHRFGVLPAPGHRKTWFPSTWTDDDIVLAVLAVARSPIVAVRGGAGSFINCFGEISGVRLKVRVQIDGTIITGHPLDGPGVNQVKATALGVISSRELPYGSNREVTW